MRRASAMALVLVLAMPAVGAARSIRALADFLAKCDGATDDRDVAAALDELRAMKHRAAPAATTLSALLPHRAKLYHDRDKVQVVRLRAHLMVTLSEIGYPEPAEWALFDTLAHLDERISAREIGAAARAAKSLGPRGRALVPYLVDAFALQILGEEEFSLERYDVDFPPAEATTIQLEALRALVAVAPADDPDVLRVLRRLTDERLKGRRDARVVAEAERVLRAIEGGR